MRWHGIKGVSSSSTLHSRCGHFFGLLISIFVLVINIHDSHIDRDPYRSSVMINSSSMMILALHSHYHIHSSMNRHLP
jgi:uncharacterized protein YqhQ